jgi:hypothetical protein
LARMSFLMLSEEIVRVVFLATCFASYILFTMAQLQMGFQCIR